MEMKKILALALLLVGFNASAQKAEVISLSQLKERLSGSSNNIVVFNFWATWCAPCVKEMPLFEKLTAEKRPNVKVTLVSMDLDLDPNVEKVHKFVTRKNLQSEVLILDAKNSNTWIDQVEKQWSGALPATIIVNQKTGQRKFVEKELHEGDLEKLIAEVQ
jgi:thiol-disulfide isomerase/thioredoxin